MISLARRAGSYSPIKPQVRPHMAIVHKLISFKKQKGRTHKNKGKEYMYILAKIGQRKLVEHTALEMNQT